MTDKILISNKSKSSMSHDAVKQKIPFYFVIINHHYTIINDNHFPSNGT